LVGLAARVVGSDAEDVVQEALIKLADDPVGRRPTVEVAAWLRRVCLNLAFNRRRDLDRWRARAARSELGPDTPEPPDEVVIRQEEQERVRSVLDGLGDRPASVLLLRYSGHSYAEIAATLDIPISSVGSTLARAERAFRAAYPEETS
jgi:RNA polymerase sigma-70 factor (ECF subfamily)